MQNRYLLTLAVAAILLAGVVDPAAAAGRPGFAGARRSLFNPFAVRPSVRPEGRINPFGLFGGGAPAAAKGGTAFDPVAPPASPEALPPTRMRAVEGDDEVSSSSEAHGVRPAVRSPFRPAPRAPF